jgi:hypothetical protein
MNKGKIKGFRMNEEEASKLTKAANALGIKESDYIRRCIVRGPSNNKEVIILLHDLMNEINYIGRNINQIVKNNNSGLYLRSDKDALLAYMHRINMSLINTNNEIRKLGNREGF